MRLALSLAKAEDVDLRVFLMGDSVTAASQPKDPGATTTSSG
jgi:sulfur relay (sulfurtransferase) complex TusBCD TusD component (DsrE family)